MQIQQLNKSKMTSWPPFVRLLLFHSLLLFYPALSFFWRRNYPFLTAESALIFATLLFVSILTATLVYRAKPALSSVVHVVLVCLVLLVQFDLGLRGLTLSIVGVFLTAYVLKNDLVSLGLPVIFALIVGASLDSRFAGTNEFPAEPPPATRQDLPLVIHILLDSFVGLEGLPRYPASRVMGAELVSFLETNQFTTFSRAYSRYAGTGDSVYSGFNFRHDANSKYYSELLSGDDHALLENALFRNISKAGYRISIYQTEFLDFCQARESSVDKCWSYMQPNVHSVQNFDGVARRAGLLMDVLLSQSHLLAKWLRPSGWIHNWHLPYHDPRSLAQLETDVIAKPNGYYFFGHVMLPHGPFSYLHDCSISSETPVMYRHAGFEGEGVLSEDVYEIRSSMYFEQADCALKSLQSLFDRLKQAGIYDQSTILLHGDHGSLIARHLPYLENLDQLAGEDYRAHFSVLFALKEPFGKSGFKRSAMALETLLEAHSEVIKARASGEERSMSQALTQVSDEENVKPFVFMRGSEGLQRVDIDIFGDLPVEDQTGVPRVISESQ